jgi:hypothetical protein
MSEEKQMTLFQLLGRIEVLEAEVKKLVKIKKRKPAKAEAKVKKAEAKPADVKGFLQQLAEAKKKGDKKLSFKLRVKLRKAGYSLRDNNKK